MKRSIGLLVAMFPGMLFAADYPSGLSDLTPQRPADTETQRLLEQQRQSGAPEQGELSTQMYVDTQKRIAETFQRPVPDELTELGKDGD
ncbi:MAG: hypothetical protein R3276_07365 [Marinobacter sp.]|nr:hypothetical protein [Marinobacter sp.]